MNQESLALTKDSLTMSEQQLEVDCAMVDALHDLVGAVRQVGSGSPLQPAVGGWVGGIPLQVEGAGWVEVSMPRAEGGGEGEGEGGGDGRGWGGGGGGWGGGGGDGGGCA